MRFVDTGCILMMLLYMYSAEGVNFKRFDVAKVIETSGNDSTDEEFDGIVVNQKLAWGQENDGKDDKDKLSNYRNSKKFKNGEYNVEKEELVEVETERHRSKRDLRKMAIEEGKELSDKKIEENRKVSSGENAKDKKRGNEREENEKAEDVNENREVRENKKNYVDSKFGEQGNMMDGNIDQDGMTETHGQNIKHQVPEFKDATANDVPRVNAYHFLMQFGYIDNSPYSPLSLTNPTTEALKKFQEFANLNVTGEFNTETLEQMRSPRCGVPDMFNGKTVFNFQINHNYKWRKNNISYKIVNTVKSLNFSTTRATIKEAFDTWETASVLKFHEIKNGNADIVISFNYGQHGDSWPFDGAGGVLAHAFMPTNGDVHFDESEDWSVNSSKGKSLLYVAVHEFGHSLGLYHSKDVNAIMFPYYKMPKVGEKLKLGNDDIKGVQALYGTPKSTTTVKTTKMTTTSPTTPPTTPSTTLPTTLPTTPPTTPPATPPQTTSVKETASQTFAPTTSKPTRKTTLQYSTITPTNKDDEVKFPCPFRYKAVMYKKHKFYIFKRKSVFNLTKDGPVRLSKFETIQRRIPKRITAAAYHNDADQTFLFSRKRCYRLTGGVRDNKFPKILPEFIRSAVVIDDFLLAFSANTAYHLDHDCEIFDANDIGTEFPEIGRNVMSAYTVDDKNIVFLKKRLIITFNMSTKEVTRKRCQK